MTVPRLVEAAKILRREVRKLRFSLPVTHVYCPLDYAWKPYEAYLRRYGEGRKRVIFLGMNPGPFGMVQTGVPFGDVRFVREWLGLESEVARPCREHPQRPIRGFACPRSEISGSRLWGLFARRFGTPRKFFRDHIVLNYCPLAFVEGSGRNRTPDKVSAGERLRLFAACDRHLRSVVAILEPEWVVGVGGFAAGRAADLVGHESVKVGCILHPSPASPAANLDWRGTVTRQLRELGVWS